MDDGRGCDEEGGAVGERCGGGSRGRGWGSGRGWRRGAWVVEEEEEESVVVEVSGASQWVVDGEKGGWNTQA